MTRLRGVSLWQPAGRLAGGIALWFLLPAGPAAAQPAEWSLHEELRIQVIEPGRTAFPEVRGVAVAPDGSLYVGLRHLRLVRAFDAEGRFVVEFGSPGIDTGQMGGLGHLGFVGDTLYVADPTFRRFVFFGADGAPRGAVGGPATGREPGGVGPAVPIRLLPDGRALFRLRPDDDEELGRVPHLVFLTGGRDGSAADTVWVLAADHESSAVVIEMGDRSAGWQNLYLHRPFHDISPDGGRAVSVTQPPPTPEGTASYTVTLLDVSGDALLSRSYEYEPQVVDREVVWRGLASAFAPLLDVSPDEAEPVIREQVALPEYAPPVTGVALGADGALWVGVWTMPGRPARWVLKDDAGDPVGMVELPVGGEVVAVESGRLYATFPSDDGFELVRYRVMAEPDGGP